MDLFSVDNNGRNKGRNNVVNLLTNMGIQIVPSKTDNPYMKNKVDYIYRENNMLNTMFIDLFDQIEEDKVDNRISMIAGKILSGKTLTSRELEFLRRYAPALYKIAMKIQAEVKAFEEQLKQCNSKEDVERLIITMIVMCLARIKSAQTSGDEIEVALQIALLNAFQEAYKEFMESDEYKNLKEDLMSMFS